jgi:hypothetical protein
MSDAELEQIIGKVRKLKALHRARERVRQLERELRGEPAKPEESSYVPEFLRTRVTRGIAPLPAAGSWTIFPPHERSTSTAYERRHR